MSALRVGDKAPDFRIKGILRGDVTDYALAAYAGKWLVLFFYPADFVGEFLAGPESSSEVQA